VSEFTVPNVSIAGLPRIDWAFSGALGDAGLSGAVASALVIDDKSASLLVTDGSGKVLADLVVRKLETDESITVSVMNVGSALLWSHHRWLEAQSSGPVVDAGLPIEYGGEE